MKIGVLNRRSLLRGVGAAMALPWMEAMLPRMASAAPQAKSPLRMAFIYFPNGAIMPAWRPEGEGKDYKLGDTLKPLDPFRQEIMVITGLAQDNGRAKGDGAGDHARGAASFLTGAHPVKTDGANIKCGMSVDQVAAAKIGDATPLASLELGIERGRDAGGCDSGYACAYSNTISWKSDTTPMAKEIHPRLVFERLFGGGEKRDTKSQARRDRVRHSVLDAVAEDAAQLREALGQTDRRKLDEYLSSVRDIERRIAKVETVARTPSPTFKAPTTVPSDIQEHIRLMYDLMTLAFQTDSTRVITFMLANEGSNHSYQNLGVGSGHHELSHHRNESDKIEQIKKIDLFFATEFARFLKSLKETKEGDGTLLDHSMIVYGSGLSDGNAHRHDDLPVVLAGKAGGTLSTGRHLKLAKETPMNNLFLSLLERVGDASSALGDSSGRLGAIDS